MRGLILAGVIALIAFVILAVDFDGSTDSMTVRVKSSDEIGQTVEQVADSAGDGIREIGEAVNAPAE